ncbi:MAG: FAD:protein FMN transferase [Ruminococcus sp.]|nr:FAD:protein FMN transferase [Ruminococcus sp.]
MSKKIVCTLCAVILVAAIVITSILVSDDEKVTTKNIFTFDTLGEITLYDADDSLASDITNQSDELNDKLDGFDESSSLSLLNQTRESDDPDLYSIIKQSVSLYKKYGEVDVTLGELIYLWDINSDSPSVPQDEKIAAALSTSGIDNISLSDGRISLSGDTSLELGSVAKGYLLNELKETLSERCDSALINLSSSILLYGDREFSIGVKNPSDEDDILATLKLSDTSVSTSGGYERYFEADGVTYSHILDAETGYPATSDILSVTVICDDALTGDFLSTALFIKGSDELLEIAEQLESDSIYFIAITDDSEILISSQLEDKFTLENTQFKITTV